MAVENQYGADSIVELKFPYTVREKVGMYLGDGGQNGFNHTLAEILDNSVDEFVAGYGSKIEISVDTKTSKVCIRDYGRGIPFAINSQGVSALVLAMTTLHAGGKHRQPDGKSAYKYSSGINGVGASVVNGVSDYFFVRSVKDDKVATITWKNGILDKELEVSENINNESNGTYVEWIPSVKKDEFDSFNVFEPGCVFEKDWVINKLKYIPYLNIGLEIILDFDGENHFFAKREHQQEILKENNQLLSLEDSAYYSEEMVLLQNKGGGVTRPMPLKDYFAMSDNEKAGYESEIKTSLITLAFNFTHSPEPLQLHFANGVKINGGKPDQSFKLQMKNTLNEFLQSQGAKKSFETEDIFSFMTFMLSVKINQPSFAGQTKDKLNNPESAVMTTFFMKKYLSHWINRLEKKDLETIVKMIETAQNAREKSSQVLADAYKSVANLKDSEILGLKGKLEDCISNDKTRNELFIVEGDSAGGGLRTKRCQEYQGFIPLRGKPLNVIKKANQNKIFDNKEILSLSYALGGIGKDFDYEKMKYNKIVILADADLDGYHISALMLTFFYHFYPDLIKKGHIYVALAPLFKVHSGFKIDKETSDPAFIEKYSHNKGVIWCWNKEELNYVTKNISGKYSITRNKGLGEMDPDDLFDTVLNPLNRKFIQVNMEDFEQTKEMMDVFMNDDKTGKIALKQIIDTFYQERNEKVIDLSTPNKSNSKPVKLVKRSAL